MATTTSMEHDKWRWPNDWSKIGRDGPNFMKSLDVEINNQLWGCKLQLSEQGMAAINAISIKTSTIR